MKNYPKTFSAAKRAEKGQWAIGDALVEEIGRPNPRSRTQLERLKECAAELTEAGMPYAASTLQTLRDLAWKFQEDDRKLMAGNEVGIEFARQAGTPAVLRRAEMLAEAEDKPLTKRSVGKARKADKRAARKAEGRPAMPEPKKGTKAPEVPVSEMQRTIRVMELEEHASCAEKDARSLLADLSDAELADDERADLAEHAAKVSRDWAAVAEAIRNPVAGEAERLLRSV